MNSVVGLRRAGERRASAPGFAHPVSFGVAGRVGGCPPSPKATAGQAAGAKPRISERAGRASHANGGRRRSAERGRVSGGARGRSPPPDEWSRRLAFARRASAELASRVMNSVVGLRRAGERRASAPGFAHPVSFGVAGRVGGCPPSPKATAGQAAGAKPRISERAGRASHANGGRRRSAERVSV